MFYLCSFCLLHLLSLYSRILVEAKDTRITGLEQDYFYCEEGNLEEEEDYSHSCDLLLDLLHSFQYDSKPFMKSRFSLVNARRHKREVEGLVKKVIDFLKSDTSNLSRVDHEFNHTALYNDQTLVIIKDLQNFERNNDNSDQNIDSLIENEIANNNWNEDTLTTVESGAPTSKSTESFEFEQQFDVIRRPITPTTEIPPSDPFSLISVESTTQPLDDKDLVPVSTTEIPESTTQKDVEIWEQVKSAITSSKKNFNPKLTSHEFGKNYFKLRREHIKSTFLNKMNIDEAPPFFPKSEDDLREERRQEVCHFLTKTPQIRRRCCNAVRAICPRNFPPPPPPSLTTVSPIQHLVNIQAVSNVASFIKQLLFGQGDLYG